MIILKTKINKINIININEKSNKRKILKYKNNKNI